MRHLLDPDLRHFSWDRDQPPALEIDSGDEVSMHVGYPPDQPVDPRPAGFSMPLSGPIWVRGASPGDTLEVHILEVIPERSGYTAIGPGYGLLPDGEVDPYRHKWDLTAGDSASFKEGITIPIAPFLGVLGIAPDSAAPLGTLPPGRHGGNMDIRQLTVGARLWLPVQVMGAKLSAGDMHAAQGDGEVCGTAIETWGKATIAVRLRKDLRLNFPQFRTLGPMQPASTAKGWHCTTGVGPEVKEAAADAVREMIIYLCGSRGLSRQEAYTLCSVTVDLRIAEIVDKPNWVVTACLPLEIFQSSIDSYG